MVNVHTSIARFLRSESGAVTVDWVVLTGALVGLGLAVAAVVSGGLDDLSGDIRAELDGTSIQTAFSTIAGLFDSDFSDGSGEWDGGTAATLPGFGDVLQLDPGETAELTLDVPPGASSATVSFDMIAGDDLSGEPATVFINGEEVSIYRDNHGNVTVENGNVSGITVDVQQHYTNDSAGAGSHGRDSRATYTITVDDPGSSLRVGVQSGADEGTSNEFYAIDDVSVTTS